MGGHNPTSLGECKFGAIYNRSWPTLYKAFYTKALWNFTVKRARPAITQGWVTYLEVHRGLAAKAGNILRVREGVTYYVGSSRVYSLIGKFGYYTQVARPVTMVKCHHCNLFHKISAGESSMPKELLTCLICEWWDACQSFWRRMCSISLGHDFGDICRPSIEHIVFWILEPLQTLSETEIPDTSTIWWD